MSNRPTNSLPSNKPHEWTGRHQQSAAPPHAPCLPLRGSVSRSRSQSLHSIVERASACPKPPRRLSAEVVASVLLNLFATYSYITEFFAMHFNRINLKYYATGNFCDRLVYYVLGGIPELAGIGALPPVRYAGSPWKRLLKEHYPSLEDIANRLGFDQVLIAQCKVVQSNLMWRQIFAGAIYFALGFAFAIPLFTYLLRFLSSLHDFNLSRLFILVIYFVYTSAFYVAIALLMKISSILNDRYFAASLAVRGLLFLLVELNHPSALAHSGDFQERCHSLAAFQAA